MAKKNDNKFLQGNEKLPVKMTRPYTLEEIEELKRCKNDILYFAENYFYIVNLDDGKQKIKLYDAQAEAIQKIINNRRTVICASRQIGKLLSIDTPIPTPSGWKELKDIKDNDMIFDWYGNPTRVIKSHPVTFSPQAYKITFSTGETLIAGEEHEWFTQTHPERKRKCSGSVKTTAEIYKKVFCGAKKEPNHRIPIKYSIKYQEKNLPIDPYLFGLWLGDGSSAQNRITCGKQYIEEMQNNHLKKYDCRYALDKFPKTTTTIHLNSIDGIPFITHIKNLNVFKNKHIPEIYLTSSCEQRMELLRGLMDSDGYINKKGTCTFYSTSIQLINDVRELVNSLGISTNITHKIGKIKQQTFKKCYKLTFTTSKKVFKLDFKNSRLPIEETSRRNKYIYIKNIEPVESVPMKCLTIEHPEQMYLVGKTFIPTHNTTLMTVVCLWLALFTPNYSIAILANKEEIAKEILERIQLAYEEMPNFIKSGVWEFTKEKVSLTNGSKIYVSTTSESGIRGKSVNLLFIDEFAHIRKEIAEPFYYSIIPTLSSSKKSKLVIVSTPNGVNNKFYNIFSDAEQGRTDWAHIKIYWHQVPGRDEAWKKETLDSIGHDERMWSQEYDLHFLEDGASAINMSLLENLKKNCAIPKITFDNGDYKIWEEPKPNRIYCIGVDAAEGIGQDNSVAQILDITDPHNIIQAGIFATNRLQPYLFAEKLNQIARSWGRPFLCIERNGSGGQIIDALKEVHGYDNIVHYSMKNDKRGVYQNLGIFCHQNSKHTGIMNLKYYMEHLRCIKFNDLDTLKEFETFIRKENGTWKARENFHDDRVMSLIWALIILEPDIARRYLDIMAVDEAGKIKRIADPNQGIANYNLEYKKQNADLISPSASLMPIIYQKGFSPILDAPDPFTTNTVNGWTIVKK